MFSYKDQWDQGCTTSKHNIYLIWLYQNIAFSYLKYDRVATRLPWLMPIKYWIDTGKK